MRSLIWFRRDLRLADNRALAAAAKESEQLLAVYFLTPEQWQIHHEAAKKIDFWLSHLRRLKEALHKLNVPLLVLECPDFAAVPARIAEVAEKNNCQRVYFNLEYEVNEKRRDDAVIALLKKKNLEVAVFHDRVLIEPGKILTGQGKPYTVYTPFRNNWAKQIFKQKIGVLPAPEALQPFKPDYVPEKAAGSSGDEIMKTAAPLFDESLWPIGEDKALQRLQFFAEKLMPDYGQQRDFPAVAGTSRLSPYLAAGVLSPRQCLAAVLAYEKQSSKLPDFASGAGTWLNELVWRDFYTHVMHAFPRVSKGLPFQLSTERVKWRRDPKQLQAWKDGLTGYPIVDAAMRQLQQTGWMHNRLRMVAAMFLSKHLLIDWREGERWFMENLVDGDLAANNGGWQWSASTGTDAAPYFRVFNPFSQSKKFDAAAEFIKDYCPELKPVSAAALHDPNKLQLEIKTHRVDYPAPVVEHASARARAIAAFK